MRLAKDDLSKRLDAMLTQAKSFQGAAARLYPLYQKFQTERFVTQGGSEGQAWPALEPRYAQYKKRRYGGGVKYRWIGGRGEGRPWIPSGNWRSWPGNGNKMMIATSTLAGAVIGPGSSFEGINHHRAFFTSRSMEITVASGGINAEGKPFVYAKSADEKRSLMKFSREHISQFKSELIKYVIGK